MDPAITKTKGPCIILAGAGTGKTRAIVEKTKYLIRNKIYAPEKIILITFSNEACNSLQTRIQNSLQENSKLPIIRTFHAFSTDLLKQHINKNFNILTPDEAKIILHANLKVPAGNCHRYINSIHTAKDIGITSEQIQNYLNKKLNHYENTDLKKRLESLQFEFQTLYLDSNKKNKHELSKEIKNLSDIIKLQKFIKTWIAYEKLKTLKNYKDYSDLNNNALALLKKNPEIAQNYDYIIVDEFQDTNKIQLDLLKHLAPNRNITVVGDINQSIYRFRGAYNKNLEEFKQHFNISQKEIFNLDKSYRSSNKILKTAHKLILNNYASKENCFEVKNAQNREGENIQVYELNNAKEEARKVAEIVNEKIKKGIPENEICVMFRNHNYGKIIKKALEFKEIPYCSITKAPLLQQRSIKIIVNYLTILNKLKQRTKGGEQAWWELIYQLSLPNKDLIKLGKFIKKSTKTENISATLLTNLTNLELTPKSKAQIKMLLERIKLMIPFISKPLQELIKQVFYCSGLVNNSKTKEEREIILNLNKFREIVSNHIALHEPDLSNFLYYLDIIKDLKIEIPAAELEEKGVRLMTLHSTKGLEYNAVIITNMVQKRFPMEKFSSNPLLPIGLMPEFKSINAENKDYLSSELERKQQISEERRLCYVAFTRAKSSLILTFAKKYNAKEFYPSQFLNEIQFQKNQDISFFIDSEEIYKEPKTEIKPLAKFSSILEKEDFNSSLQEIIKNNHTLPEPKKKITFSPSSLILFSECQKKYEYRYIFNMPEEKTMNWEAIRLGSFVHRVLEKGVKKNFRSLNEFINCTKELHLKEDWESVELENALHLIKIFYERNKHKFNKNSKTEQKLTTEIEGLNFLGFADRIDFSPEGLEIIDYKTGSGNVPQKNRNWQLGYYAIASAKLGKVKKVTLDMLKHEKPLEFEIDEKGNAKAEFGRMAFNIDEVKEELVEEAKKVLEAYKYGFKPCPAEKNCEFCEEYFYN